MAIILTSNYLEDKLKKALIENHINFQEQKMFYEKPGDIYPKYVVDFYLTFKERSLIVECDGFSFHSSDKDIDRDIKRDQWFKQRKYSIRRFTRYQIERELNTVIIIIKNELGIEHVSKRFLKFHGKKIVNEYIHNVDNANLHNVELFYYCTTIKQTLFVAYKFRDNTVKKFSDERTYIVNNIPQTIANDLAIYLPLKDLNRSTNLVVYCPSEWLTSYFNRLLKSKQDNGFLEKIDNILQSHNYYFKHINIVRNIDYYETISDERLILSELKSRVNKILFQEEYDNSNIIDYDTLIE